MPETTPQSVDVQFKSPEKIKFGRESLNVVDIVPPHLKTKTPLFLAPGWAAGPNVFRKNITSLAQEGRRVMAVYAYHGIKTEPKATLPDVELRKAMLISKLVDQKNLDKVDAVGHSEAGIYLTIAAGLFPEKFRNIVLVNPAGIIGQDDFKSLTLRFSADIIKEVKEISQKKHHLPPIIRSFIDAGKAIALGPKKSLQEGVAISQTQINDQLEQLKKQSIGIAIIHAGHDKVFPMARVQRTVKPNQVHGFYSVVGTHNTIYLEAEKMSAAIDDALTALEKRPTNLDTNLDKLLT